MEFSCTHQARRDIRSEVESSLPRSQILEHDFVEAFIHKQNFIATSMQFLNEDTLGKIARGCPNISEIEDLTMQMSDPGVHKRDDGRNLLLSLLLVFEVLLQYQVRSNDNDEFAAIPGPKMCCCADWLKI